MRLVLPHHLGEEVVVGRVRHTEDVALARALRGRGEAPDRVGAEDGLGEAVGPGERLEADPRDDRRVRGDLADEGAGDERAVREAGEFGRHACYGRAGVS